MNGIRDEAMIESIKVCLSIDMVFGFFLGGGGIFECSNLILEFVDGLKDGDSVYLLKTRLLYNTNTMSQYQLLILMRKTILSLYSSLSKCP